MADGRGEKMPSGEKLVALVGNPNVGKSVVFSLLTGKYVTVSNYPGTTVEITRGTANFGRDKLTVFDTPGANSLTPSSEDEAVTRDILLRDDIDSVIQVADAKNLRRSLLLSVQLAEMGIPFVLDLNMMDEAKSRGVSIDTGRLKEILGVDVVTTVATEKRGIEALKSSVSRQRKAVFSFGYEPVVEEAIGRVSSLLDGSAGNERGVALMLLCGDKSIRRYITGKYGADCLAKMDAVGGELAEKYGVSVASLVNQTRLRFVDSILRDVLRAETIAPGIREQIGRVSMHRIYGVPILLAVLFLLYEFVGVLGGGTLVDFFENVVFGRHINPAAARAVDALFPSAFVHEFLVGQYGLITMAVTYAVAIVLPIVGTFFIAFGILEDSGYMPRLAIMANRAFKTMGLNGKAVLPMILGLGCDTMATLTARILESKKERILVTLLLALGVPCSAQMGVILGMLGGLSPSAVLIWGGVITGIIFAVGFLGAKVIPGRGSDFILEIPPMRIPRLGNVTVKTLARMEWYLKEAVPLFVLGTILLFVGDKLGLLGAAERIASPVVSGLLGLPAKATEAFIVGFLRRDYGAAGLYMLAKDGMLSPLQVIVSLVTITLFVPCVANFFIMVKERGLRTALYIVAFIFPFAFLAGGILRYILVAAGYGE